MPITNLTGADMSKVAENAAKLSIGEKLCRCLGIPVVERNVLAIARQMNFGANY